MANEVEIVIRARDQSAPGIEAATRRIRHLKEEAASVGDATVDVHVDAETAKLELEAVHRKAKHLDGEDVRVDVHVDVDRATSRLDSLQEKLKRLKDKGFSPLITAALALGPALLPIAGQAITAVGSLATSFASAAMAAGVFGAVIGSTFGEVKEAASKTDALREKIRLLDREAKLAEPGSKLQTKLLDERAKATLELTARLSQLPPATRKVVQSFEAMKTAWGNLKDDNKETSFGILTRVFKLAQDIIPKLQPLFDAGAHATDKLISVFERKVKDGGVERLIKFLADHASGALSDTVSIFTNLATALGNFMKATDDGGGALHWVEQMTQKLADFTGSKAFLDFLEWVRSNGKQVGKTLGDIAKAAVSIGEAVAPLSPISLALADALAAIINAIPEPVLTGIVAGLVAYSVAVKTIAVAQAVWAVATGVMTAAQWALNVAMDANPIGIVIVAVAALAAGLIYAYQHSETFRRIVNKVGSALLTAGKAAWNFQVSLVQAVSRGVAFVIDKFGDMATFVGKVLSHIPGMGAAGRALQKLGGQAHTAAQKIRDTADAMNAIKSRDVSLTVRHVDLFSTKKLFGPGIGPGPWRASGGIIGHAAEGGTRGGQTMVGEHGPELVDLAPGSTVHSNPDTERMLGGGSTSTRVVLEINSGGSAMDDLLVQIIRKAVRTRGGDVQLVLGR